ncbi:AsmA2 domain-containing protein YhdP [Candidatus Symbiopectobacterium sp.]|uniref:AsmA2 domain-containing protein YhdP n=1 Tax=Candidatus Symbiopectobacterium sp. TaxID=2816440 RepID=UPI0025BED1C2|nr:AsmA2 domain-containing protein YhdP [Candidatus Symbiopectobacterium sp.]
MRRLPGLLLMTGATIVVVVALIVSGLRLAMPQLDRFRPQIMACVTSTTGVSVDARRLTGSLASFGPTLSIDGLTSESPAARWRAERITLALDVWQSLLHARWQFRDLTFHRVHLTLDATLTGQRADGSLIETDRLSTLFLQQFDHFDLRDSRLSFLTPSGDRAELAIPQLTWLNRNNRHRAEGQISLSSFNGQHGVVQVRMDLQAIQGHLNDGTVYLQADNIDMKPWISRWLKNNTGLDSANFNLAAWLQVRSGALVASDVFLAQGSAAWKEGDNIHRLSVDELALHATREGEGWQVAVPVLNLATDGVAWPKGSLAASWIPASSAEQQDMLRVRASELSLARLRDLLPLLSTVTPELKTRWEALQPEGLLTQLDLDIPLKQPEKSRFQAAWRDLRWKAWEWLPGGEKLAGTLSGSVERGRVTFALPQTVLPSGNQFRAPFEIQQANGAVDWINAADGWEVWSKGLNVQARALQAQGDFQYRHPVNGEPRLDILAVIRLANASEAWRYFPEPLIGAPLVNYLNRALKGGHVDNATLIFAGNPSHFPFEHNEGQFQVWVPLRAATFEFEAGWPVLSPLDIDLNFANNGLWMSAPSTQLGNVAGRNILAAIPDYSKEKLLIDGELQGEGPDVGHYFEQTPLKDSVGSALKQLQIGGNVNGTLHLDIPLAHGAVEASGDIQLSNNSLYINPLNSTLKQLKGRFHYRSGTLNSDDIAANWLGQPVTFSFNTEEQEKAFLVKVVLKGEWAPALFPGLPKTLQTALSGTAAWRSDVTVNLPYKGVDTYEVSVDADLKNVSTRLHEPLNKAQGTPVPLKIAAKGDLKGFTLAGSLGKTAQFNSQWLLSGDVLTLARAIWQQGAQTSPTLPEQSELVLALPALDAERWLGLLPALRGDTVLRKGAQSNLHVPESVTLRTPALKLLGQQWHDVVLNSRNTPQGNEIHTTGREIDANLTVPQSGMWRADIRYLYYNPQWKGDEATNPVALAENKSPLNDPSIRFEDWPALQLACGECWIAGQNLGQITATLQPEKDKLTLSECVIDTGKSKLTASGSWQENAEGVRTALKGRLTGGTLEQNADWFGIDTPLRAATFDVDYDLYWRGSPWAPHLASLSGILHTRIGKGDIVNAGTGQAGRLLRLVSFDALLRKLQFDFSDTFGKGFYFDSIRSTAWIKDGVLHTDDLLVDGLEADIAMKGSVDLANRQIAMEAVIAPEISATVGVATAFVVNPVIGAAVFAASKVLAPLWNKISLIRYQIHGSLDQPTIKEVLREQQKNAVQELR